MNLDRPSEDGGRDCHDARAPRDEEHGDDDQDPVGCWCINLATIAGSEMTAADIAVSRPMALRLYPTRTASRGNGSEDKLSAIEKMTVAATAETVSPAHEEKTWRPVGQPAVARPDQGWEGWSSAIRVCSL